MTAPRAVRELAPAVGVFHMPFVMAFGALVLMPIDQEEIRFRELRHRSIEGVWVQGGYLSDIRGGHATTSARSSRSNAWPTHSV